MNGSARRDGRFYSRTMPVFPAPVHWINTIPVESTDVPCVIEALDVQVRVCGLYADVVETMVIRNPNRRDMSADIAIPLPDRAVVCGYALDVAGQMIDGVVVPKEKARMTFETEQRKGADPGLVESVKGNVYRTRVYPIARRGTRTVRLRYVAPLLVVDGEAAFLDAPMPAGRLGKRAVRVDVERLDCPPPELSGVNGAQFREVGTCWSVESEEFDVEPDSGLRVALPKLPASFALVERDDEGEAWFCASEIAPPVSEDDVPEIPSLMVAWDVSGSRASVDHAAELELLRCYCAADSIKSLRLMTFGDHADPAIAFDSVDELVEHIGALRYDGGSDFNEMATALAELPDSGEDGICVLFTDGMDTLGDESLAFPKGWRVLAVASGVERDVESLRQACGGLVFDLATAPRDARAFARALFSPALLAGVEGEGIADVMGIGYGDGGRYTAVGKLEAPSASISFANTNMHFELDADTARQGSVIPRAWASMRMAQLSPRASDNEDALLDLGRRFGVVSPVTSLLVLESLEQWLEYDIEPPVTWRQMHHQWMRARRGRMLHHSDQMLAEYHLQSLKRDWAELKEWWERDLYPKELADMQSVANCPRCGASIESDSRFCRHCGAPIRIPFRNDDVDFADSPSATGSFAPLSAPDSVAMEDGYSYSMPDSACESADHAMSGRVYAACAINVDASEEIAAVGALSHAGHEPTAASVQVQAWMPDAEYLTVLDEALAGGAAAAREAYFQQRSQHAASPSFFIDCAGWFMANGDAEFGLRVLTNLAELRIEDAALLRVMAWRLREAGELNRALATLRRVLKLRPEDSQSHRDVALVLDELARCAYAEGDEGIARERAEEAGTFYRKLALTPWQRRAVSIGLFAVEEYNVLRAWADAQAWETAPKLESLGAEFEGVLDCDLRITLAWDADETDVDLHVTEPTGEEAYFGNRNTYDGGRVSEDITDGYGPELYEIRHARDGVYTIRAHYYASHQQTVFGPASCTLTVYTDWGRPAQKQQITSMRLDNEHQMLDVGTAAYGTAD